MYGLEAVERLIEQGILWKEFIQAIRVKRIEYHEHAAVHFKNFGKDHEATLDLLMNLRRDSSFSNYQGILNYLSYWINDL